ncbi:MAG TPA: sugar ABC transporter permease [Clostridiaceae bacterium]|jgi:multiple sugar transport system permease protein|nr:sugar ABC transporter permease [Clostridiaceae bacterium]
MNNKLLVRRNIVGYYMLIPATILFLLINAFPLVYGLILSLTDKNYTKPKSGKFVGLENFKSILHDSEFWSIMGYTIVYTVFVVAFSYLLGLALAVLLNKNIKFRGVFRALALFPWVIPTVVAAQNWRWLFNDQLGFINRTLMELSIIKEPILFLANADLARLSVIIVAIWKSYPFMMVVLLAGLQSIGDEMYEPAYIDGANRTKIFWYITMPTLKPMSIVCTTLMGLWTFNTLSFDNIYLLTQGGPSGSTYVMSIQSYYTAIYRGKIGYASAISVMMMVIIALAVLIYAIAKYTAAIKEQRNAGDVNG